MNEESAMGRGIGLSAAAMVAALVSLLAFAPLASAASDPLASGTTTVKLDNGLYRQLKRSGVRVLGVKPATVRNGTVTLPVSGGKLDPLTGKGFVGHSGGIRLKRGRKAVVLTSVALNTAKKSLSARLGGKTVGIAAPAGISRKRDGFGVNVSIRKLKLTAKAAKLLNGKLGVSAFAASASLGSSSSKTQPRAVTVLASGKAMLNPNLETLAKLVSLGVETTPTAPAEATLLPPSFLFPIGGGTIAPDASSGIVETTGGLKLQKRSASTVTTMTIYATWADLTAKTARAEVTIETNAPGAASPVKSGRISIADVSLAGATVKSNPVLRTVTVENASASLQEPMATTLNQTFAPEEPTGSNKHREAFKKGDPLGTFSFTAQTR